MKLIVNGVEYDCVLASKTADSVEIADDSGNVTTFSGIKNMEDYVLEDGEWYSIESTIEEQIVDLKSQLAATDYKAIKYAEGWITEEEYAPIRAERQALRDKINELEGGIS